MKWWKGFIMSLMKIEITDFMAYQKGRGGGKNLKSHVLAYILSPMMFCLIYLFYSSEISRCGTTQYGQRDLAAHFNGVLWKKESF